MVVVVTTEEITKRNCSRKLIIIRKSKKINSPWARSTSSLWWEGLVCVWNEWILIYGEDVGLIDGKSGDSIKIMNCHASAVRWKSVKKSD